MKCARLNLQERSKPVPKRPQPPDKPRRYCQRRMVNPDHSEDPRWNDLLERFQCTQQPNYSRYGYMYAYDGNSARPYQDGQDLVLTVQNLKFQGDVQERRRPRTSFKYKSLTANRKHRMFVKQVVDDIGNIEDDRTSEMTSYFYDDYVKYILSADRSRPSSSKSSVFLQDLSTVKLMENKSTQVDQTPVAEPKNPRKDMKAKNLNKKVNDQSKVQDLESLNNTGVQDNTKVAFHKSGKRKSLTISRAQSPETIQVIRVDVVCNYSSSSIVSDYEDDKRESNTKLTEKDFEKIDFKKPHFADKYLLTNTIKSINENLSCGSKVTLLCKTYKLTDRSKGSEKKYSKSGNNTKNKHKNKVMITSN